MTLNCDQYRVNVESVKALTIDKNDKEIIDFLGILAISTGVPIIVVCCYIGELYGFSPLLFKKIDSLKQFYGVTQILNTSNTVNL